MALDFDTYLVASSPTELQLPARYNSLRKRCILPVNCNINTLADGDDFRKSRTKGENDSVWEDVRDEFSGDDKDQLDDGALGFGLTKCENRISDVERIQKWMEVYNCSNDSCLCVTGSDAGARPRVTFADDCNLATVHVIDMTSEEPPLLQYFTKLQINGDDYKSDHATVSLSIKFDQPVANYITFYHKLSECNVSLENIVVVDKMKLVGTIKVRNIAETRSVMIRCTFDDWKSFSDVSASPVVNSLPSSQFDTFEFSISVPSPEKVDMPRTVQFAVCYSAGKDQYWDNNGEKNYCVDIVVTNSTKADELCKDLDRTGSWSEFAAWTETEMGLPYW